MNDTVSERLLSFWFFRQLFTGHATSDHLIHFRVIHNERPRVDEKTGRMLKHTKAIASNVYPVKGFKDAYTKEGGVFDQLTALNTDPHQPSNIYHAMALRTVGKNTMDKASCIGFSALFLDMDVTPQWSLAERWQQITYWGAAGFHPTIIVGSGRGLQPIWILKTRIDTDLGEPILKRMVDVTGCKGKGNCWDITRILRTPGFLNQKEWYEHNSPKATILFPSPQVILATNTTLLERYDWEKFKEFPVSGKDQIAEAEKQAKALGGSYAEIVQQLTRSVADHQQSATIREAAGVVLEKKPVPAVDLEAKKTSAAYAPILHKVPHELNDIPIPKKIRGWFNIYCTNGANGMSQKQIVKVCETLKVNEIDASAIDSKVMYQLVKCRYSFDAIQNFWERPDLKLHREDKMADNPNYLRMTYDKMLQDHVDVLDQTEQAEAAKRNGDNSGLPIFIGENGYTYIEKANGKPDVIITGSMKLVARYYDMDEAVDGEQEHLSLDVLDAKKKKHNWLMKRSAFASLKEFKKQCKEDMYVYSNKENELHKLLHYITHTANGTVEEGRFHSNIKYVSEENEMIFPNYAVKEKEIEFCSNPALLKAMKGNNHLLCTNWIDTPTPRHAAYAEFNRVWKHVLRMHAPKLIMACLGTLATTAMRQIFHGCKGADISVPTLNIRGATCSGKTETVSQLYRLTGCSNPQSVRMGASSSVFGMSKMIETFKTVPVVIDEFKEEEEGQGKNRHMQNIRNLVRNLFSGETIAKGRANLSMHTTSLKASLWVSGESMLERPGHVAEMSRIFTVNTDAWDITKSISHFTAVERSQLEIISPYFYQYLLNLDVTQEWEKFTALKVHYAGVLTAQFGRLSSRVAANAACILYGIQLWDRFVQYVDQRNEQMSQLFDVENEIVTYMSDQAGHSGTIVTVQDTQGNKIVRERDEAMVFLSYLGRMVASQDKVIMEQVAHPCWEPSSDFATLYIFPNLAYDAYRQHSIRLHYQIFEYGTIMHRINSAYQRKEAWILDPHATYAVRGGPAQPAIALSLPALRAIGIWPLATGEELITPATGLLADI